MPSSHRAVTRRSVIAAGGLAVAAGAVVAAKGLLEGDEISAAAPAGSRRRVAQGSAELRAHLRDLRSGDRLVLVAGTTYLLDATLQLRGSDILLDGAGATVRLADGAERDSDRVIDVIGSRNTVRDLVVARRPTRQNGTDHSWTVQVMGDGNTVQRCTVDVANGYAIGIARGDGNVIADNTVTGGGILYGWNEVSNTQCLRNTVSRTSGNAFSGVGNSDSGRPVRGCVVTGNTVVDCGRIAIEDFSNVEGTRIEGNRITGSRYMGISAVGARTVVVDNVVLDGGRDYGIETGASGNVVQGNTVRWTTAGSATGLIVNDRWKFGDGAAYSGFRSQGNTITNASLGISLNGRLPAVELVSDTITDAATRGISVEPTSAASVRVTGVKITFSGPAPARTSIRDGISVALPGRVTISGCTIDYGAASAGSAKDYFVRVEATGVTVTDCTFDSSSRRDANRPVVGSVSGPVRSRVRASGNSFTGR